MTTGDDATGPRPAQERNEDAGEPPADGAHPVVSRRTQDGVPVLVLSGELDLNSVADVAPVLDEALASQPEGLVVDLSRVDFADSSALNLLLRTHSRTSLHVAGPLTPFVKRLFEVTGISGVLNLHSDVDEAVRAAAAAGK